MRGALAVVSETETDMTGFETDGHCANWLGLRVCPQRIDAQATETIMVSNWMEKAMPTFNSEAIVCLEKPTDSATCAQPFVTCPGAQKNGTPKSPVCS